MQVLLILAGALAICDTLITLKYSRMNIGMAFPAVLGLPLMLVGIFYGVLPCIVCCIVLAAEGFLLLIMLIGSIYIVIKRKASAANAAGADIIIVLGYSTWHDTIPETLKKRVERAYAYLNDHPTAYAVLSGGTGDGETRSEAELMYEYILKLGADSSRLIIEDKSRTTMDNFAFSVKLINKHFRPGKKVCYITSNYHVPRAGRIAAKYAYPMPGLGADGVRFITPNDYIREVIVWIKQRLDRTF